MDDINIQKLAEMLKWHFKEEPNCAAHAIWNPTYQKEYFAIFLEVVKNKSLVSSESFKKKLLKKIGSENESQEKLRRFMDIWDAWIQLYQMLKEKSYIRSD